MFAQTWTVTICATMKTAVRSTRQTMPIATIIAVQRSAQTSLVRVVGAVVVCARSMRLGTASTVVAYKTATATFVHVRARMSVLMCATWTRQTTPTATTSVVTWTSVRTTRKTNVSNPRASPPAMQPAAKPPM